MPQLEITTFPSQIFWLIISFAILYFCISRLIIPKISRVLKERKLQIEKNISESEILYKKTEDINRKYEDLKKETEEESKKIIKNVKDETNKKFLENTNIVKKNLEKILEISEKKISQKKDKALKSITSISLLLSKEIIKKISNKKINTKSLNTIIKRNSKVKIN